MSSTERSPKNRTKKMKSSKNMQDWCIAGDNAERMKRLNRLKEGLSGNRNVTNNVIVDSPYIPKQNNKSTHKTVHSGTRMLSTGKSSEEFRVRYGNYNHNAKSSSKIGSRDSINKQRIAVTLPHIHNGQRGQDDNTQRECSSENTSPVEGSVAKGQHTLGETYSKTRQIGPHTGLYKGLYQTNSDNPYNNECNVETFLQHKYKDCHAYQNRLSEHGQDSSQDNWQMDYEAAHNQQMRSNDSHIRDKTYYELLSCTSSCCDYTNNAPRGTGSTRTMQLPQVGSRFMVNQKVKAESEQPMIRKTPSQTDRDYDIPDFAIEHRSDSPNTVIRKRHLRLLSRVAMLSNNEPSVFDMDTYDGCVCGDNEKYIDGSCQRYEPVLMHSDRSRDNFPQESNSTTRHIPRPPVRRRDMSGKVRVSKSKTNASSSHDISNGKTPPKSNKSNEIDFKDERAAEENESHTSFCHNTEGDNGSGEGQGSRTLNFPRGKDKNRRVETQNVPKERRESPNTAIRTRHMRLLSKVTKLSNEQPYDFDMGTYDDGYCPDERNVVDGGVANIYDGDDEAEENENNDKDYHISHNLNMNNNNNNNNNDNDNNNNNNAIYCFRGDGIIDGYDSGYGYDGDDDDVGGDGNIDSHYTTSRVPNRNSNNNALDNNADDVDGDDNDGYNFCYNDVILQENVCGDGDNNSLSEDTARLASSINQNNRPASESTTLDQDLFQIPNIFSYNGGGREDGTWDEPNYQEDNDGNGSACRSLSYQSSVSTNPVSSNNKQIQESNFDFETAQQRSKLSLESEQNGPSIQKSKISFETEPNEAPQRSYSPPTDHNEHSCSSVVEDLYAYDSSWQKFPDVSEGGLGACLITDRDTFYSPASTQCQSRVCQTSASNASGYVCPSSCGLQQNDNVDFDSSGNIDEEDNYFENTLDETSKSRYTTFTPREVRCNENKFDSKSTGGRYAEYARIRRRLNQTLRTKTQLHMKEAAKLEDTEKPGLECKQWENKNGYKTSRQASSNDVEVKSSKFVMTGAPVTFSKKSTSVQKIVNDDGSIHTSIKHLPMNVLETEEKHNDKTVHGTSKPEMSHVTNNKVMRGHDLDNTMLNIHRTPLIISQRKNKNLIHKVGRRCVSAKTRAIASRTAETQKGKPNTRTDLKEVDKNKNTSSGTTELGVQGQRSNIVMLGDKSMNKKLTRAMYTIKPRDQHILTNRCLLDVERANMPKFDEHFSAYSEGKENSWESWDLTMDSKNIGNCKNSGLCQTENNQTSQKKCDDVSLTPEIIIETNGPTQKVALDGEDGYNQTSDSNSHKLDKVHSASSSLFVPYEDNIGGDNDGLGTNIVVYGNTQQEESQPLVEIINKHPLTGDNRRTDSPSGTDNDSNRAHTPTSNNTIAMKDKNKKDSTKPTYKTSNYRPESINKQMSFTSSKSDPSPGKISPQESKEQTYEEIMQAAIMRARAAAIEMRYPRFPCPVVPPPKRENIVTRPRSRVKKRASKSRKKRKRHEEASRKTQSPFTAPSCGKGHSSVIGHLNANNSYGFVNVHNVGDREGMNKTETKTFHYAKLPIISTCNSPDEGDVDDDDDDEDDDDDGSCDENQSQESDEDYKKSGEYESEYDKSDCIGCENEGDVRNGHQYAGNDFNINCHDESQYGDSRCRVDRRVNGNGYFVNGCDEYASQRFIGGENKNEENQQGDQHHERSGVSVSPQEHPSDVFQTYHVHDEDNGSGVSQMVRILHEKNESDPSQTKSIHGDGTSVSQMGHVIDDTNGRGVSQMADVLRVENNSFDNHGNWGDGAENYGHRNYLSGCPCRNDLHSKTGVVHKGKEAKLHENERPIGDCNTNFNGCLLGYSQRHVSMETFSIGDDVIAETTWDKWLHTASQAEEAITSEKIISRKNNIADKKCKSIYSHASKIPRRIKKLYHPLITQHQEVGNEDSRKENDASHESTTNAMNDSSNHPSVTVTLRDEHGNIQDEQTFEASEAGMSTKERNNHYNLNSGTNAASIGSGLIRQKMCNGKMIIHIEDGKQPKTNRRNTNGSLPLRSSTSGKRRQGKASPRGPVYPKYQSKKTKTAVPDERAIHENRPQKGNDDGSNKKDHNSRTKNDKAQNSVSASKKAKKGTNSIQSESKLSTKGTNSGQRNSNNNVNLKQEECKSQTTTNRYNKLLKTKPNSNQNHSGRARGKAGKEESNKSNGNATRAKSVPRNRRVVQGVTDNKTESAQVEFCYNDGEYESYHNLLSDCELLSSLSLSSTPILNTSTDNESEASPSHAEGVTYTVKNGALLEDGSYSTELGRLSRKNGRETTSKIPQLQAICEEDSIRNEEANSVCIQGMCSFTDDDDDNNGQSTLVDIENIPSIETEEEKDDKKEDGGDDEEAMGREEEENHQQHQQQEREDKEEDEAKDIRSEKSSSAPESEYLYLIHAKASAKGRQSITPNTGVDSAPLYRSTVDSRMRGTDTDGKYSTTRDINTPTGRGLNNDRVTSVQSQNSMAISESRSKTRSKLMTCESPPFQNRSRIKITPTQNLEDLPTRTTPIKHGKTFTPKPSKYSPLKKLKRDKKRNLYLRLDSPSSEHTAMINERKVNPNTDEYNNKREENNDDTIKQRDEGRRDVETTQNGQNGDRSLSESNDRNQTEFVQEITQKDGNMQKGRLTFAPRGQLPFCGNSPHQSSSGHSDCNQESGFGRKSFDMSRNSNIGMNIGNNNNYTRNESTDFEEELFIQEKETKDSENMQSVERQNGKKKSETKRNGNNMSEMKSSSNHQLPPLSNRQIGQPHKVMRKRHY